MPKNKFTVGCIVESRITHNDFVVTEICGSRLLCKSPGGVEVLLEAANLKLVKKGG